MPKPKATVTTLPMTDLLYAVQRLIASGKTTAPEGLRLAADRVERIKALEAELLALTGRGRTRARNLRATAREAPAAKPARRKLTITPERRGALRVQGQYIGMLHGLPKAEKAKMKALAARKGMEAAVEAVRGGQRWVWRSGEGEIDGRQNPARACGPHRRGRSRVLRRPSSGR